MVMNNTLSQIVIASGGTVTNAGNRNSLLAQVVIANGGTVINAGSMNKLLAQIVIASGGSVENEGSRNNLLAKIIIANGGTVTNAGNRNQLFEDWLGAIATRLIYNLDGIDDFWTMPVKSLVSGDTVELKFIAPSVYDTDSTFIDSLISDPSRINVRQDGSSNRFLLIGCNATLDGVAIVSGLTFMPTDGIEHTIVISPTLSGNIVFVGNNSFSTGHVNFPIYDVDIQAASGNRFYPVNDGWLANPLIADTLNPQSSRSELWASDDYGTANNATVTVITSGLEWDIQSPVGQVNNLADGGRTGARSFVDGKTYEYTVESSEPINVVVYTSAFAFVASGINNAVFTQEVGVSYLLYVTPRTTNTVRVSSASVKEYTHGTAFNFNEERWVETNV